MSFIGKQLADNLDPCQAWNMHLVHIGSLVYDFSVYLKSIVLVVLLSTEWLHCQVFLGGLRLTPWLSSHQSLIRNNSVWIPGRIWLLYCRDYKVLNISLCRGSSLLISVSLISPKINCRPLTRDNIGNACAAIQRSFEFNLLGKNLWLKTQNEWLL